MELEKLGSWQTLTRDYGLQDGHDSSVAFVAHADGHEVFMQVAPEDGGDGATNDWGVWISPALGR